MLFFWGVAENRGGALAWPLSLTEENRGDTKETTYALGPVPSEDCCGPVTASAHVVAAIEDNFDAAEVAALEHLVGGLKAAHKNLSTGVELLRGPGNHRPQATRKASRDQAAELTTEEENRTKSKHDSGLGFRTPGSSKEPPGSKYGCQGRFW